MEFGEPDRRPVHGPVEPTDVDHHLPGVHLRPGSGAHLAFANTLTRSPAIPSVPPISSPRQFCRANHEKPSPRSTPAISDGSPPSTPSAGGKASPLATE